MKFLKKYESKRKRDVHEKRKKSVKEIWKKAQKYKRKIKENTTNRKKAK